MFGCFSLGAYLAKNKTFTIVACFMPDILKVEFFFSARCLVKKQLFFCFARANLLCSVEIKLKQKDGFQLVCIDCKYVSGLKSRTIQTLFILIENY